MHSCKKIFLTFFVGTILSSFGSLNADVPCFSGIYPSLSYYNQEGECGTGAVVPWSGSLWVITYGPHLPKGSSDRLYEITPDKKVIVHKESVGGTPANRMIHNETGQLVIGPYVIDRKGNVRVVHWKDMPGRLTGNARHLTDPEHKIYYGTMEEGFYEVDLVNLKVNELYQDGNFISQKDHKGYGPGNDLLPGVHGKGLYSGQGVMVYSNNGEGSNEALTRPDIEAGVLAEWDGKDWKTVRRNQFTEVTGPGGVYGNKNPDEDPIWATGWDHKSVIFACRDSRNGWSFYRLPKASHSYDGAHGWNTEWPRIRNVGTYEAPDYLMTMHGMFWRFPGTFANGHTFGIRPRGAYLKVIGDFCGYDGGIVFGCDDTAKNEFLNTRKVKGGIAGPGQSHSNLWFTSIDRPDQLGATTAEGSVWSHEDVESGHPSEPMLFAGWDKRMAWVKNEGDKAARFTFEVDKKGNGRWSRIKTVTLKPGSSISLSFDKKQQGEWVRVVSDTPTVATASFTYTGNDNYQEANSDLILGLATAGMADRKGGLLYSLPDNRRALGILANRTTDGKTKETGYYELDSAMNLVKMQDTPTSYYIREKIAIPVRPFSIEKGSVLIVDDSGRRWRLPLGDDEFTSLTNAGMLRVCREVATERDLFSCMGTFYELPAENADGFAKIRPVSTHNLALNDYASYRGMLVLTGTHPNPVDNPHIVRSADNNAAVWCGAIDDLWEFGKPKGHGGPWISEKVSKGDISDPYLIGFYDHKTMDISSDRQTKLKVQVDPTGNGDWMDYLTAEVNSDNIYHHDFPTDFQARWIRFIADGDATVTTQLNYK